MAGNTATAGKRLAFSSRLRASRKGCSSRYMSHLLNKMRLGGPGARGQSMTNSNESSPRNCRRRSLVADTVPGASSFIRVRPSRARPQSFGRGGSTGGTTRLPWLLAALTTRLCLFVVGAVAHPDCIANCPNPQVYYTRRKVRSASLRVECPGQCIDLVVPFDAGFTGEIAGGVDSPGLPDPANAPLHACSS